MGTDGKMLKSVVQAVRLCSPSHLFHLFLITFFPDSKCSFKHILYLVKRQIFYDRVSSKSCLLLNVKHVSSTPRTLPNIKCLANVSQAHLVFCQTSNVFQMCFKHILSSTPCTLPNVKCLTKVSQAHLV